MVISENSKTRINQVFMNGEEETLTIHYVYPDPDGDNFIVVTTENKSFLDAFELDTETFDQWAFDEKQYPENNRYHVHEISFDILCEEGGFEVNFDLFGF